MCQLFEQPEVITQHYPDIIEYIKDEISDIVNPAQLIVAGEFTDEEQQTFLIHFVLMGQNREIEFLGETCGTGQPIVYYRYGTDDIIKIADLKQYLNDQTS